MGLPFINDFIKHFKTILQKRNIIQGQQDQANIDILVVDVSSIVFKYMMGYYLANNNKGDQNMDPIYSDEEEPIRQNDHVNLPSIQDCITKVYSYAQIFKPNVCQILVFDPIPQKVQQSKTNPNKNKRLLELLGPIQNQQSQIEIDFEQLKQIKVQTWQQRSKSKYPEASNAIKHRMTQLYNNLEFYSEQFQSTHIVLSKYESDIMIGSLCGYLSPKYNVLTISEDSDMLVHAYPGKVYIPHNGVFDTCEFWKVLNIHSKNVLSQIPYHYGCDYQLKTISITSKESFQFINDLNNKQSESNCQNLISYTFLYETLIENDFQYQSLPL